MPQPQKGSFSVPGWLPIFPQSCGETRAAAWALDNLRGVLEQAGTSMERVIQVTFLITNSADYQEINAEYVKHFPHGLPARHTARFGVPTQAKCGFACIALAGDASD